MTLIGASRFKPIVSAGSLGTTPGEPVTVAEAKTHLRYSNSDQDTYIGLLISVARGKVEHMTHRSILRTALVLRHAAWLEVDPSGAYSKTLVLPRGPVVSVTSVQYRQASDGAYATLASDQYELVVDLAGRSCLVPAFGVTLPPLYSSAATGNIWDAVKVQYIAGTAADAPTAVDQRLRMAIMMLVAYFFERRETTNWDVPDDLASSLRGLTHQLSLEPF